MAAKLPGYKGSKHMLSQDLASEKKGRDFAVKILLIMPTLAH